MKSTSETITLSEYVNHIADLAQLVESGDPIDWGLLSIDEQEAYKLMSMNVIDTLFHKYNEPETRDVIMATIVKLTVENFVLNLKLRDKTYGSQTIHM